MIWTPITIEEIFAKIYSAEKDFNGNLLNFWDLIKIYPEKWDEVDYGREGGGFWVVGLIGRRVIYYNDIEEGFNISEYSTYGTIDDYYCNQDDLNVAVLSLYGLITFGGRIIGQAGPPI
ncbi:MULTISPECIES: hypothetical protein [unclassified Chryseobacterium]|uniref:hypothetical protein n=1 Tax=unclassified Chryseobacterium TaxID=2593645 RepID=UPI0011709E40|nr:hypothetical protein [Chryseobacterium sp. ON_d1]GEJ46608.1 hypothetical protein CRS_32160 [Chryseobacterium sp. ON_d1]